jgi:hypothetical protein
MLRTQEQNLTFIVPIASLVKSLLYVLEIVFVLRVVLFHVPYGA